MATTGYWDNKGDPATKVTWANPEIVPESKRSNGGWYYNPASGYVDRWWSGTQPSSNQNNNTSVSTIPSSSDQLPSYLEDFQKTAMESLSSLKPAEVPTFEELKTNLTSGLTAPDLLNRAEERAKVTSQLGITDLETELNTIKTDEQKIYDDLKALTGTEEGKPVAMNVISGRITEEERVAQQRLAVVTRQKNSIINELNTKYNVVNTYMSDLNLDYQDAVNQYNTDFEKNYKVQSMITDMSKTAFEQGVSLIKTGFDMTMETAKFEQTVKQASIDNARANLTTIVNAINSGNMNLDSASPEQKLQIQKLEIQSGLPVGTVASMGMSPKDRILAFSSDNSEAWVVGSDGKNFNKISTGLTPKGDSTSSTVQKKSAISKVGQYLNNNKNSYGHVSPQVWDTAKSAWVNDGFDIDEFTGQFRSYTDPNRGDFDSAYGITKDYRTSGKYSNESQKGTTISPDGTVTIK